uniref:Insulin like 3 n=1 Tax=Microcebus murinus TaxID=30608 RepID=A0A8C6EF65_MICMU
MGPRVCACALALLGAGLACTCGHPTSLRALPQCALCGAPRWSPEPGGPGGRRDLLQWLERRHLLLGLVAHSDPALAPGLPPRPQASPRHRRHRAASANPARRCCLSGCSPQDLLTLCPH